MVDSFPDVCDNSLYLRNQTEDIWPYGTTTQHESLYGLLMEYDQFRALLPLEADPGSQEFLEMGKDVGNVSVLLLADQSYAPLNPPEWIANLRPQLVVPSVAVDDREGRPDREALDVLSDYSLLRTDQQGWIQIVTDGQKMWVEVER